MRASSKQASMLCLVWPESMVPHDHPLRAIKKMADAVLNEMSATLDEMYADTGRKSIPPERPNRCCHRHLSDGNS